MELLCRDLRAGIDLNSCFSLPKSLIALISDAYGCLCVVLSMFSGCLGPSCWSYGGAEVLLICSGMKAPKYL